MNRNLLVILLLIPFMIVEIIIETGYKKNDEMKSQGAIRKIMVTTVAGDGTPGYVDGPVTNAKFRMPLDVAVHNDGTIYVADAFNRRIRKISGGQVSTFAGDGERGTRDGVGTAAGFMIPTRITLDAIGNLYTVDANDCRVRKISPQAGVSTYAGKSKPGFMDGEMQHARFGSSFGLAIDIEGSLYVGDSENRRVRKITDQVNTIAGNGNIGYADGESEVAQFSCPSGIVVDQEGNVFVADLTRIRRIAKDGMVSTFAGNDQQGYLDGEAQSAQFTLIEDMVIDQNGNIYLTDDNRIRKINSEGTVTTVAGSTAGYNDGDADSAKFNSPQGLGIDKKGNIYVADFNNNSIRKISFQ